MPASGLLTGGATRAEPAGPGRAAGRGGTRRAAAPPGGPRRLARPREGRDGGAQPGGCFRRWRRRWGQAGLQPEPAGAGVARGRGRRPGPAPSAYERNLDINPLHGAGVSVSRPPRRLPEAPARVLDPVTAAASGAVRAA